MYLNENNSKSTKKSSNSSDPGTQNPRQDAIQRRLSLQHLIKLFREIKAAEAKIDDSKNARGVPRYRRQSNCEGNVQQEQRIYQLLPLFHKVFCDLKPHFMASTGRGRCIDSELLEEFEDLPAFTSMLSRLMVNEIRRRASNRTISTPQDASRTIVEFLVPSSEHIILPSSHHYHASNNSVSRKNSITSSSASQENSNTSTNNMDAKGWMLLTTLNLLAHEVGATLIPIMTSNSLPSTLVKCLYLFFDLPPDVLPLLTATTNVTDISPQCPPSSSESNEQLMLLHRVFSQLVITICAHQSSLHELTRKDDLALLFNAITSWCIPHNIMWRSTAADVIIFMAKCNCMDVNYLHEKSCLSSTIENMSRLSELSKASENEITDMLATTIDFINEIYSSNAEMIGILLDDFKQSSGYFFIVDFVLKLERDLPTNSEVLKKIMSLLTTFTKLGTGQLKPRPLSINQLFIIPDFTPPKPNPQHSIKNLAAFTVLKTLWFKAKSTLVQELILAGLYRLYRDDGANYFILDSQNTLSQFADKLHVRNISVQEKFFAILKYIIFELKYVPCKELISVSLMIKSNASPQSTLLCLKSLLSVIKFHCVFRDVYREVGLLDIIITVFKDHSQKICDSSNISETDAHLLEIQVEIIHNILMGPNNQNCSLFCEAQGQKHIFNLLPLTSTRLQSKQTRKICLLILQQLISSNSGEEIMAQLLSVMHTHESNNLSSSTSDRPIISNLDQEITMKINILKSFVQVLRESHRCRTLFRKIGGFIHVMSVLVDMEGCLADAEPISDRLPHNKFHASYWSQVDRKKVWTLLKFVLLTLNAAMRFEPANARFFACEICPVNLTDSLRLLGCFTLEKNFPPMSVSSSNKNASNLHRYQPQPRSFGGVDSTANYQVIFSSPLTNIPPKQAMTCLESCCLIIRLLYDMALDLMDNPRNRSYTMNINAHILPQNNNNKNNNNNSSNSNNSNEHRSSSSGASQMSPSIKINERPPSLPLTVTNTTTNVPLIIHSSVVLVMYHVLPSIPSETLQTFIAETLNSLLKSERNQQTLCDANLLSDILSDKFEPTLVNERHYLHSTIRYVVERLSAQSISPKDLKYFLRLGNPVNCLPLDVSNRNDDQASSVSRSKDQIANRRSGRPIPLSTIKTLVSMLTPKDLEADNLPQPPFVEFDMSHEGFSCLFLPSIAPINPNSNSSATSNVQQLFTSTLIGGSGVSNTPESGENSSQGYQGTGYAGGIVGGIGTGERNFPPQAGLTYLTWICVDSLPACDEEAHNVRLLTIVRTLGTNNEYACLQLQISARDRALLISTQETQICPMSTNTSTAGNGQPNGTSQNNNWDPSCKESDYNLRVWSPEMLKENRWHHVVMVLNRALLKNSTVTLYVDGHLVSNQRLHYISSNPGWASGSGNQQPHVNAVIGTPPQWRKQSRLIWKQGPCQFIEEPLTANYVKMIYALGPHYFGSLQGSNLFQTMIPPGSQSSSSSSLQRIPEDKIVFGLSSKAMSTMTLLKMKRVYSRFDCRQISKRIGLSMHENATPIHVLHNNAGHLCGPSRCLGGILIGYIGARCFVSRPVSVSIQDIGGSALLLGLVANAQDGESLYASLKALISALRVNKSLVIEMVSFNGYQTLAMLLRRKKQYLNPSILHLSLNLSGTLDVYRKNKNISTEIQRPIAFRDLLCNQIDLWMHTDLLRPLLEHFHELLMETSRSQRYLEVKARNLSTLREMGLLSRLLQLLWVNSAMDSKLMHVIENLLFLLLNQTPRSNDLLYFGQYIAALLPTNHEQEKTSEQIELRNSLLKIVLKLITRNSKPSLNIAAQEDMINILGFDWFLIFLQGASYNEDTVAIGLVNLMVVLSHPTNYIKFKEATSNGGWLKDAEHKFASRFGCQIMGLKVSSPSPTPQIPSPSFVFTGAKNNPNSNKIVREDLFTIPGFQHLSWLITHHVNKPQIYLILFQGLLGRFVQLDPSVIRSIESFSILTLENLCSCLFGEGKRSSNVSNGNLACPDLSLTILSMIHTLVWDVEDGIDYAIILIQFFICLYHNWKEFQSYCHLNGDFLNGLCGVIIAKREKTSSGDLKASQYEARKLVMSFIRLIVVDSMICSADISAVNKDKSQISSSVFSVFETALTAFATCKSAQTELINLLMNHIDSYTEVLTQQKRFEHGFDNQQNSLYQQTIASVNAFALILSDKLWQDCYEAKPKEVLQFQLNLIERFSKWVGISSNLPTNGNGRRPSRSNSNNEIGPMYKSLNRTTLYLLSRPSDTIADRMAMLENLQKIHTSRQTIIHSPYNNDPAFYACLTYCLLQLIDEEKVRIASKSNRVLRHSGSITDPERTEIMKQDEGALLIASVSRKIWAEVYLHKKSCLEEALKMNLTPNTPNFGITSDTPDLGALRDTLQDSLFKFWTNYVESERCRQKRSQIRSHSSNLSIDSPTDRDPTALISEKLGKINRAVVGGGGNLMSKIVGGTTGAVSGAISTMVSGSTTKKDLNRTHEPRDGNRTSLPTWDLLPYPEVASKTFTHISVISQLVDLHIKQKCQSDNHLFKYIYDDWIVCENEILIRERGVWGPERGSRQLDKWQLDMTEGPHRVRKKLIKNDMFYLKYPYREELSENRTSKKRPKYPPPMSFDSKDYYKRNRNCVGLLDRDPNVESDSSSIDRSDDIAASTSPLHHKSQERENSFEGIRTSSLLPSRNHSSDQDDTEGSAFEDIQTDPVASESHSEDTNWAHVDSRTVLRLLEDKEKISHMFRCARILGLDTYEGLLLFAKEHFYLLDGFTLLKTREIRDIDSLPPEMHDPIIPTSTTSPRPEPIVKRTKKICMKFAYEDIKEVHKRRYLLQPIALEVFSMDGRISLLVFPRKLCEKVFSRFMSVATHITDNAQDSLSGQKRNVNVESGAGLLSSLMGDTSVTQRWVRGEISNFQYLMHLNTLAGRSYNDLMQYPVFPWILADYTSAELDLTDPTVFRDLSRPMGAQTPERLEHFRRRFNEWDELNEDTPAYHYGTFYSSAMIVASYLVRMEPFTQHFLRLQGGHFDLADRMFHSVGDAFLSAAKNNVADVKELIPEFFTLPEFLLNSNNYDLGVKQSGIRLGDVILPPWAKGDTREFIRMHRAALECDYVSSHLHEWIDLIFGFKQQGRPAVEAVNVFHHLFYEGNVDIYTIEDPLKKNATIGFINNFGQIPKQLFKKPHPSKKIAGNSGVPSTPILPSVGMNNLLLSSPSNDKLIIHHLDLLKPSPHPVKELRGAVGQMIQVDKNLLAVEQNKVLIPPTYNRYVAWGFADHSIRIGAYESDRAIYIYESEFLPPNGEILYGTIPNPRTLITAGTSSVISVWRLKEKSQRLQLIQHLYGHSEVITCLTSSSSYGLIVSGSRDRTCIVWDLNRLLFVRQLGCGHDTNTVHPSPITSVAINDSTGDIVTCSATWLFFWSINGVFLTSVNTISVDHHLISVNKNPCSDQELEEINHSNSGSSGHILCAAFSLHNEWELDNVIMTGSSDGIVRIWSLEYVQVPVEEKDPTAWGSSSTLSEASNGFTDCETEQSSSCRLSEPPTKDEIVRRMSLASVVEETIKEDDSSEDSETLNLADSSRKSSFNASSNVTYGSQTIQIRIDAGTPERRDSVNPQHQQSHEPSQINSQPQISSSKSLVNDLPSIVCESWKDNEVIDGQSASNGVKSEASRVLAGKKKPAPIDMSKIRASKSDNSLMNTSMMEDSSTFKPTSDKSTSLLKPGFKWARKLTLRGRIPPNKCSDRREDIEPIGITSLMISKDCRTVFVGDARGRIYAWSVADVKSFNN